jgi:MFS family permease
MAEPSREIPARVKGLSLVSLFNDFASEMVYPVLPAFITGPLGGSALALGALDGAADLTAALTRWLSGRLADRKGWTKPLIFAGYGAAVLVRPLIAVASAAWQVVGFRVLDRIGKGLRSPARDAVIARVTDPAARGRAFGFNRAADHFGAVLGSLIAWLMLQSSMGVREVIGWSALPGLLAIVVLIFALRGALPVARAANAQEAGEQPAPRHAQRDAAGRSYWLPVTALVLLTVARLPETLLLLRLQDLGVPVAAIPLAWAGLHVIRTASSYPGGLLTDRVGARWTYALGGAAYLAAALFLAGDLGEVAGFAVFLSLGLVAGLTEPAERVVIGRLAPVRTGRGFGNYQALAGLAALPAGIGFGALYRSAGGPAALLGSAAVLGIVLLGWLWVARGVGRTEPPGRG